MKRCAKCGRELPESEFHRDSHAKDGLKCRCKACTSKGKRANRDEPMQKGAPMGPRERWEAMFL